MLAAAWPALSVAGIVFQILRERGRRPFPLPRRLRQGMSQPTQYLVEEDQIVPRDEHQGLLANSPPPSYDSIAASSSPQTEDKTLYQISDDDLDENRRLIQ